MKFRLVFLLCILCQFAVGLVQAQSGGAAKAMRIVESAAVSADMFGRDPNMSYLHQHLADAKAVLIVPQLTKGAFIVGGSGGSGVLLKRGEDNVWSYPAFYTMASGSIGFQIGGEQSEIALMIMTEKGVERLLTSSFKLGTDASVAAGPVGFGAKAQTADVLAFSRTQGIFAGASLEGTVITVRSKYNAAYYGGEVLPVDIIVTGAATNPHADKLRAALAELSTAGDKD